MTERRPSPEPEPVESDRPQPVLREDPELVELRARLEAGLDEALAGDFAEGSGEEVIRRVFAEARRGR